MPRKKRIRRVVAPPGFMGYKPYGHWRANREPVELLFEEFEAIKLIDYCGLNHQEASEIMKVSRPTFARIYENARQNLARALIEMREIKTITGNTYIEKPETKMKKRLAIPTSNGLLYPHFGHCKEFTLVDIKDGSIVSEETVEAPPHQPGKFPVWLAEKGVTDVIAGGIGQRAIGNFESTGINVISGASRLSPSELAEGFINDNLILNPGQCHHD